MRLQAFLILAVKMQETAHGVEKPPRDRNPKPKPAGKTAASGIRLVKIVIHLRHLGVRHADTRIIDIYDQINPITLLPVINPDVNTALFRKLDGILHQNLKYMGYLLRISNKRCRNLRVDIKHHLQLMDVALHRRHSNHVVEYRRDHILFPCRRKRALHDLRIIHHIVDLIREPSARHLDRLHIRPKLRRDILPQQNLADSDDHIDRRAKLMGHIR